MFVVYVVDMYVCDGGKGLWYSGFADTINRLATLNLFDANPKDHLPSSMIYYNIPQAHSA